MRRYRDPIEVATSDGAPVWFRRRGRAYTVNAVEDHWLTTPPWWREADPTRAAEREHWQVRARSEAGEGGVYVVRLNHSTGAWTLTGVWD